MELVITIKVADTYEVIAEDINRICMFIQQNVGIYQKIEFNILDDVKVKPKYMSALDWMKQKNQL